MLNFNEQGVPPSVTLIPDAFHFTHAARLYFGLSIISPHMIAPLCQQCCADRRWCSVYVHCIACGQRAAVSTLYTHENKGPLIPKQTGDHPSSLIDCLAPSPVVSSRPVIVTHDIQMCSV